jgi:ankyrin repeat protein
MSDYKKRLYMMLNQYSVSQLKKIVKKLNMIGGADTSLITPPIKNRHILLTGVILPQPSISKPLYYREPFTLIKLSDIDPYILRYNGNLMLGRYNKVTSKRLQKLYISKKYTSRGVWRHIIDHKDRTKDWFLVYVEDKYLSYGYLRERIIAKHRVSNELRWIFRTISDNLSEGTDDLGCWIITSLSHLISDETPQYKMIIHSQVSSPHMIKGLWMTVNNRSELVLAPLVSTMTEIKEQDDIIHFNLHYGIKTNSIKSPESVLRFYISDIWGISDKHINTIHHYQGEWNIMEDPNYPDCMMLIQERPVWETVINGYKHYLYFIIKKDLHSGHDKSYWCIDDRLSTYNKGKLYTESSAKYPDQIDSIWKIATAAGFNPIHGIKLLNNGTHATIQSIKENYPTLVIRGYRSNDTSIDILPKYMMILSITSYIINGYPVWSAVDHDDLYCYYVTNAKYDYWCIGRKEDIIKKVELPDDGAISDRFHNTDIINIVDVSNWTLGRHSSKYFKIITIMKADETTQNEYVSWKKEMEQKTTTIFKLLESYTHHDKELINKQVIELMNDGAGIDEVNKDGKTALAIASQNGNINLVRELLALDAFVNKPIELSEKKKTPLYLAIEAGHLDILELLYTKSPDKDRLNYFINDACLLPSIDDASRIRMVKFLIAQETPTPEYFNERTIISLIIHEYSIGTYQHLETCLELISVLVNSGVDPNSLDRKHRSPIWFVVQLMNNRDPVQQLHDNEPRLILDLLIELGGDPNIPNTLPRGMNEDKYPNGTAVHIAAYNGDIQTLRYLVRERMIANINMKLPWSTTRETLILTPLRYAIIGLTQPILSDNSRLSTVQHFRETKQLISMMMALGAIIQPEDPIWTMREFRVSDEELASISDDIIQEDELAREINYFPHLVRFIQERYDTPQNRWNQIMAEFRIGIQEMDSGKLSSVLQDAQKLNMLEITSDDFQRLKDWIRVISEDSELKTIWVGEGDPGIDCLEQPCPRQEFGRLLRKHLKHHQWKKIGEPPPKSVLEKINRMRVVEEILPRKTLQLTELQNQRHQTDPGRGGDITQLTQQIDILHREIDELRSELGIPVLDPSRLDANFTINQRLNAWMVDEAMADQIMESRRLR